MRRYVSDALALAAAEELKQVNDAWSTAMASRRWCLTQLGNKSVRRAIDHLKRCGYESYYPMTLVSRAVAKAKLSHAQRANASMFRDFVKQPLFGGYLFVHADLAVDNWHQAFRDAGVYGIACLGGSAPYSGEAGSQGKRSVSRGGILHIGRAEPISCDELVARLRAREDDGAIPGTTRLADLFEIGEMVRVASGPFASFGGTIESIDEKNVATVLIELFGRLSTVKLEFSDFEKL